MGDHEDCGVFFLIQSGKLLHQRLCIFGIQGAGWFVRQDEPRLQDQGPGCGDPLFLPSGHLGGKFMQDILNFQIGRELFQALPTLLFRNAVKRQGKQDIFPAGQMIQKFKILEQISDLLSPVIGKGFSF